MVPLHHFDRIEYKKPSIFDFDASFAPIVGFDSEAYRDGTSFMYCTSTGDVLTPGILIDSLMSNYLGTHFVVWNLKYESGAIMRVFPRAVIKKLQQSHEVEVVHNNYAYKITYIPHKRLRIKKNEPHGQSVTFWDIAPFYGRSKLQKAAQDYLGDSKISANVEHFTRRYVQSHFADIARYCVYDAALTQRLALLWIDKFQSTGIPVTSLYSEASISFSYISKKTDVVTAYEYWESHRKLVQYAFESYEGGKFEVTARGKFYGYEYDISSAYPFAITNLLDIRDAVVVYGHKYNLDAAYGFLRVRITVSDPDVHLPCGVFRRLRLYPIGTYYLTITKQEYDYIVTLPKTTVDIIDAAWLILRREFYPYRDVFNELYALKTEWKKKDKLRSNNYKIIMNGFYGKMAQCILGEDGKYHAGIGWNPIYASIITAETRISVTRLQNLLKKDCLAVHTDSVITRYSIPNTYIGKNLGDYELVVQGDGVLVACGIYEIAGQCALKGFRKGSVTEILKDNPNSKIISLKARHVESWLQSMAQNHPNEKINLFSNVIKKLKLNCDTKRIWPKPVRARDLLASLQYSEPVLEHQDNPPDFWDEK
jgi:hypothetical protein